MAHAGHSVNEGQICEGGGTPDRLWTHAVCYGAPRGSVRQTHVASPNLENDA